MRLWSIHPQYLDPSGLVALWRETLLARKVLEGKTAGYRHHPQLERFRAAADPEAAINRYLETIYDEACLRGYSFDGDKLAGNRGLGPERGKEGLEWQPLPVTRGQLDYERRHLLAKLTARAPERAGLIAKYARLEPNPTFREIPGGVESWEKVTDEKNAR